VPQGEDAGHSGGDDRQVGQVGELRDLRQSQDGQDGEGHGQHGQEAPEAGVGVDGGGDVAAGVADVAQPELEGRHAADLDLQEVEPEQ
jgi:hypothetical protein